MVTSIGVWVMVMGTLQQAGAAVDLEPLRAERRPVRVEAEGDATHRFEVSSAGVVYAWARSDELDSVLQVLRNDEAVGEDDDTGGGTTAWLEVRVADGDELHVRVTASDPSASGAGELCVMLAPEPGEVTALEGLGERTRAEARRLQAEERPAEAADALRSALQQVRSLDPRSSRPTAVYELTRLGELAVELGDHATALSAFAPALAFYERVMPPLHRHAPRHRGSGCAGPQGAGQPPGGGPAHARGGRGLLAHVRGGRPRAELHGAEPPWQPSTRPARSTRPTSATRCSWRPTRSIRRSTPTI